MKSLNRTHQTIRNVRFALMGLGTYLGGGALFKGLIGFNARVEDSKNNIASMLALARKTTVVSQLQEANQLYENLRKRASELPGTTEDYIAAMSRLTYPIMTAGLGLKDLEDLTVNAVVAAKGLGHGVKAALTDVVQGIEGRYSTTDFFLKALLEPRGYEGAAGRKRFKALSKAQRAKELKEALSQGAIVESAQRQAESFTGQMDKVREATAQFLGRIGVPLFKALGDAIRRANKWLDANRATVDAVADTIGRVLGGAFSVLGTALEWLASNSEEAKAVLWALVFVAGVFAAKIALAWALALGPIIVVIGRVAALVWIFNKLRDVVGDIGAALITAFGAALMFRFGAVVKAIRSMTAAMVGFGAVSKSSALAAAGAAALPGARGAAAFAAGGPRAAKGGGGVGGGAMAALLAAGGPVGVALGAAMLVDAVLPTNARVAELQEQGMPFWDAMTTMYRESQNPTINQAAAGTTSAPISIGDTNISITGISSEQLNEELMRRVIAEERQKELRHIQNAVAGGSR
ncbi:MAG: hypothetical protein ACTHU0_01020 [Kofleriaceae bacterium]